ncbi:MULTISPECIES: TonB-dependent receptor [unclassified Spirosoma]|uniref:TonB-dependent receptor n=1 Tax=unclassified Spirosoma TaxID=2621999 RepID=UPI00095A141F|nr:MULTISPECIES: TonB-dependent receptor [unclassified Spirosoma]MBN8823102.1 TonB-dependent receptor [Spirosoma sp.]OJW73193.1 MAG: TonB-dependent receptor [Spirosoma sp. 48-14]
MKQVCTNSFLQLYLLILLNSSVVWAQNHTIKGTVLLADGTPGALATIQAIGTPKGTTTDEKGHFILSELAPGNYHLQISMIGYATLQQAVTIREKQLVQLTVKLQPATSQLNEVIVTGQYEPQSLKKSVYNVRVIDSERIRLRAAVNVMGVLNNELGFRFSNDLTLGTTDVQLMGMSGRNVKILLDGLPMVDRGDTRESLNQIDINSIERIEIVEGPMSVSYGSDALAGVVNIITKKPGHEQLSVTARIQEETVGKEYNVLTNQGLHIQNAGITWQKKGWNASAGVTNNTFGGWQGQSEGRVKDWLPKDQLFGHGKIGYRTESLNVYYRLDALKEDLLSQGAENSNTHQARDQKYITNRYVHQLQSDWKASERLQFNGQASLTDYQRRTQTTILDVTTNRRTLSLGQGEQDIATFTSQTYRATATYKVSPAVSLQPGIDINRDAASGDRILGSPSISDYAFFVSSTLSPTTRISIRPGLRFIKNSVYNAPPVIPSLNTKFALTPTLDLRLAYARGFRSPALRELYFNFFDASHSIRGNPNLKAENSNSFNGSLVWQAMPKAKSTLGFFYNDFNNLITYGIDPSDPRITTNINIDRFKTTGVTLENVFSWKALQATVGFSYIGRYNNLLTSTDTTTYAEGKLPTFIWSPEANTNLTYTLKKLDTKVSLFYKYTGKRPSYLATATADGQVSAVLTEIAAFHWADLTLTKPITSYLTLTTGAKNLFNITRLANTSTDTGGAHSSGGPSPVSYGRSYFLGLNFQWSKN